MAKHKTGKKIRQEGMVKSAHKKHARKAPKAPWSDPLESLSRGGSRH